MVLEDTVRLHPQSLCSPDGWMDWGWQLLLCSKPPGIGTREFLGT